MGHIHIWNWAWIFVWGINYEGELRISKTCINMTTRFIKQLTCTQLKSIWQSKLLGRGVGGLNYGWNYASLHMVPFMGIFCVSQPENLGLLSLELVLPKFCPNNNALIGMISPCKIRLGKIYGLPDLGNNWTKSQKSYYVMVMFLEVTIFNVYMGIFLISLPNLARIPLYSITQIQLANKTQFLLLRIFILFCLETSLFIIPI